MRALLAKLLQRAQTRAATLGDTLDQRATDAARDEAAATLARWKQVLARDPENVDACLAVGTHLVDRGEHAEALPLLRRAAGAPLPSDELAAAHRALGVAEAALGDRAAAAAHFATALDRGLRDETVYADLCALLAQGGDRMRAEDVARDGLLAFPGSAQLHGILGNLLGMAGDYAGAAQSYERANAIGPPSAETHYNLGIVLGRLDRPDEAIATYRRAVALDTAHAAARLNLGNALRKAGNHEEALIHYANAARIAPDWAEAHYGEGVARRGAGDPQRALASLERALALAPADTRVHIAIGGALEDLGRHDDAVARFEEGLRQRPGDIDTLLHLGNLLLRHGDTPRAIERYREVLAQDPANGVAHLVKALTGGDAERAPDPYVTRLFDDYADKFDSHLVKELRYEMPHLVATLLTANATAGTGWEVLDLGCGTGLVGVEIAPYTRRIVGVDLSPGMLAKARETGRYERLEAKELVGMMRGERASSYDVVTAADVFVYVGRLDDAAREIARVLRPGGLVAFSVESLDAVGSGDDAAVRDRGYRLNSSGRYAHSRDYLRRLADEHRFSVAEVREVPLRLEQGRPVEGYVVLWRGAGTAESAGDPS